MSKILIAQKITTGENGYDLSEIMAISHDLDSLRKFCQNNYDGTLKWKGNLVFFGVGAFGTDCQYVIHQWDVLA